MMDISQTPKWQPTSQRLRVAQAVRRSAFSIVELAIVLLVIGILAGIAIPKFGTALNSVRARGAANWIKSDMCYAQRLAQQTSAPQTITFDASAESYVLPNAININHSGQTYMVSLSDSKFHAQIDTVDFAGSSTVIFDIYGRPDNAGTVVALSGNTTETIQVDAAGQVTIQ